jgi:hypothetical protein
LPEFVTALVETVDFDNVLRNGCQPLSIDELKAALLAKSTAKLASPSCATKDTLAIALERASDSNFGVYERLGTRNTFTARLLRTMFDQLNKLAKAKVVVKSAKLVHIKDPQ